MTSRERMQAVLCGQVPDYTPIFPKIAFSNVIACEGMRVIDYMTDPECMARACITAYRTFGWDGVALHTDIASEGMALGSRYTRPEHAPSELKHHLMRTLEDLQLVTVPDPTRTEPMKTVLAATRIVKEQIGAEAYVAAWTNGPLNVASQVLSLDELLMGLLDEPEAVHALLRRCTEVSAAYARELVKAGADCIAYGHATASSTVISREHYREFALPYEKQLVQAIHQSGAKAVTHICGNIEPIADLINQNGADIIDFDHACDIRSIRRKLGTEKPLRGNIDPTLLAFGTPQLVRAEVKALLQTAKKTKGRLILGTGCEVALNTPAENLHAFVDAGREFGKR